MKLLIMSNHNVENLLLMLWISVLVQLLNRSCHRTIVMPIDLAKRTARMPWGIAAKEGGGAKAEPSETTNGESQSREHGVEFPLNCFFGQMGVAPAPNLGHLKKTL